MELLATWVHHLDPFALRLGESFGIRWYGLAYAMAFLAAYAIYRYLARHGYSVIPAESVGDFITGVAIFGVLLGGRLGYMLFYDLDGFLADPLIFFRVWEGGMSSHGGILGIVAFTLWYSWRHQVSWPGLGDNLVVGAPIGLFLGRCANFINGELYGRPSSVPWAVKFPKELFEAPPEVQRQAILAVEDKTGQLLPLADLVESTLHSETMREALAPWLTARHPSQLYAAALEGLLLFALLWILRTRWRTPNGTVTGAFFVGYAILRILSEVFREPDAPLTGVFTRGQFLSLFLILIGAGFWIAAWMHPQYPPALRRGKANR